MTSLPNYQVNDDIRQAATLPGSFYRDSAAFDTLRERAFARSWQWIGDDEALFDGVNAHPFQLLPGHLDEPLLLTRDQHDQVRCLSNVCTHRANLLLTGKKDCKGLTCGYHGRRFDLAGRMLSMPEFEGVANFPSQADNLPQAHTESWHGLRFASLSPEQPLADWIQPVERAVGSLPLDEFRYAPELTQEYTVQAHWALYVDNYLEGFHIPFVHPELARAVDFQSYDVRTYPRASLQRAWPRPGELAFEQPLSNDDGGNAAAAYYFWLYPNTMLNFYPWGLSVNIVLPQSIQQTKVVFHSFLWRPDLLEAGAGGSLDQVQREDELVVEGVQAGVRSRLYQRGRFSPKRESAVHHFHRLLGQSLRSSINTP